MNDKPSPSSPTEDNTPRSQRAQSAALKKQSGRYNCTEAVLCSYAQELHLDESALRPMALAFAAGMGNMEGTCGALVGAGMVLGMLTRDRAAAMRGMKHLMTEFKARNSTTVCHELKGISTGCPLRACPDCVADAVEMLDRYLETLPAATPEETEP